MEKRRLIVFGRLVGLLFILAVWAFPANSQTADTLRVAADTIPDSSRVEVRSGIFYRIFAKDYPNPRTAAFLSLALPGAGQAYNRSWWKVPVVYGVLGGLTWVEINNVKNYRVWRDNYKWKVDGDAATNVAPEFERFDRTELKYYRDAYRRTLEQSSLLLGLAYLLTASEAFVDAHLQRFDVSDDLSLQWRPAIQTGASGPAFGLGLRIGLSDTPTKP